MNGHLPCLRMLSYRTCFYTTRYPPPHTNNRYALLVSLCIIQIFYYIQYRKKKSHKYNWKKSKGRLIFRFSYPGAQGRPSRVGVLLPISWLCLLLIGSVLRQTLPPWSWHGFPQHQAYLLSSQQKRDSLISTCPTKVLELSQVAVIGLCT